MLAKKHLTKVMYTINLIQDEYGSEIFNDKKELVKFIKKNNDAGSESMQILIDFVNNDYFENFAAGDFDRSIEILRETLAAHKATEEQIDEFENTFYVEQDSSSDETSETTNDSEADETAPEESDSVPEPLQYDEETEEEIEDDDTGPEQKVEYTEEESDEEIEEADEPEQKKETKKSVNLLNKNKNSSDGIITFAAGMVAAVVLFILSLVLIKPTGDNKFYTVYYILFILFTLMVLGCCCLSQRTISLLCRFYRDFKKSKGRKEDLISKNKGIKNICNAYAGSFLENETYNKTRANADLYFGAEPFFNDMNRLPVQQFLKIIPGTFIGFGILGTFIGFAGGLSSINISDSQSLLNGVQNLLDGLKNAFNTSIVGVLASMFLNFVIIHPLLKKLDGVSKELCDYLDSKFYVSEVDAMSVTDADNRQIPFPQTMGIMLEKLEQISSNINQMGATVGDQVTQSVKETLDKTIEKIIGEEIRKLKDELNNSISLLKECQQQLQNAPEHLKEAAERMQSIAISNDELYEMHQKKVEEAGKEMLVIKESFQNIPEEFLAVDKALQSTTAQLAENQNTIKTAITDSTKSFAQTNIMAAQITEAIVNLKETSKENREILEGFKTLDEQLAKIFEKINSNTKEYGEVVGDSLKEYLNGFQNATKDISAKFTEATNSLRLEIDRLNKS